MTPQLVTVTSTTIMANIVDGTGVLFGSLIILNTRLGTRRGYAHRRVIGTELAVYICA